MHRAARSSTTSTALRFRDHLAVLLLPDAGATVALESVAFAEVGRDRASGLAVLRIPEAEFLPSAVSVLRRPEVARILIAAVASGDTVTLRPLVLDALSPVDDPIWGGTVWALAESCAGRAGHVSLFGGRRPRGRGDAVGTV